MKSFCIKTNNQLIINYLLSSIENIPLENVYFINRKFKIYNNVIIHYTGNDENVFVNYLSDILTDCIITYYEPNLFRKIMQ